MSQSEVQQLFQSIQSKMAEDERQLGQANAQLNSLNRELKITDLVLSELNTLDDKANTYKSVGKMFIYTPKDVLVKELETKATQATDNKAALTKKAQFLQRHLEDANNHLRDLLHSKN